MLTRLPVGPCNPYVSYGYRGRLLADAETGKNPSQQIVGGELAGDLGEGLLRQSQFFRRQFAALLLQLLLCLLGVGVGAGNGVQVSAAGADTRLPSLRLLGQFPVTSFM